MELSQQSYDSNFQPELTEALTTSKLILNADDTSMHDCNKDHGSKSEASNTNSLEEEDKAALQKVIGPPCHCRLGCYNKVPEEVRKKLHKAFWKNCTWEQQKQYIALSIIESPKSRSRCRGPVKTDRRQVTCIYTLPVNNEFIKVCKGMFLNTFSVSEKLVRLVLEKKRFTTDSIFDIDFKVKKTKKSDAVKEMVRQHIRSFPSETLPGDPNEKKYLDSSLNVSLMHKLYVKQCQEKSLPECDIVRQAYYREIFNSDFNLGFKSIK